MTPKLLTFDNIGSSQLGYITVAEAQKNIPFDIKRVYWTFFTPQDVVRGGHAHRDLQQVIFAVSGTITFNTEDKDAKKELAEWNQYIKNTPDHKYFTSSKMWKYYNFTTV